MKTASRRKPSISLQREQQTLEGLLKRQRTPGDLPPASERTAVVEAAVRGEPVTSMELTFPDTLTRMRRDHMKYLTLIRAIALLHQHQRPVKTERGVSYIEVDARRHRHAPTG